MWRELEWDDDSETHIARHDVTPMEVEQVVNSRPRHVAKGRDDTTQIYGQTNAGRYLLAVIAEGLRGGWTVVTARDMTDTEARTFREKGR